MEWEGEEVQGEEVQGEAKMDDKKEGLLVSRQSTRSLNN